MWPAFFLRKYNTFAIIKWSILVFIFSFERILRILFASIPNFPIGILTQDTLANMLYCSEQRGLAYVANRWRFCGFSLYALACIYMWKWESNRRRKNLSFKIIRAYILVLFYKIRLLNYIHKIYLFLIIASLSVYH